MHSPATLMACTLGAWALTLAELSAYGIV